MKAHPPALLQGLLVIPCYQESARLPAFLEALRDEGVLQRCGWTTRLVDDGSGAEAIASLQAEIMRRGLQEGADFELMRLEQNQGKGAAVYSGWREREGKGLLAFVDADGAVPASEVARLLEISERLPQTALFASRVKMRGRTVTRSFKRHLFGRIFASLVGRLIDPHIYDSQCGLKIIPAAAFTSIEPWMQERRFAFDVELLAALLHAGVPIQEVPIDWHDIPGSKVRLVRDSLKMFWSLRTIAQRRKTWKASGVVDTS